MLDSDISMNGPGLRRTRSAKLKAKEILAEGEGSTTEDDMDVDQEPVTEGSFHGGGRVGDADQ
jgi:hypothetical protein